MDERQQQEQEGVKMNIYQRLNEVRKEVEFVKKEKRVGEGGYLAVTHDAVTALCRASLIKHGVVLVPSLVTSATVPTGTFTAKGVPYIRYEARYKFNVVNADAPEDCFSLELEAHALDQGDKAPGKALSYAKKYVVLKLLEIESGEEEEEREFQKSRITPNSDAGKFLKKDEKQKVEGFASSIIDCYEAEMPEEGFKVYEEAGMTNEEKMFLWTFLDSKIRSSIKRQGEAKRKGNGNGAGV